MLIFRPFRFLVALAALCLASAAGAQVFPTPSGTAVIDDATMIAPEPRRRWWPALTLAAETGARVMVVTLVNTALYAGGEDVPAYARLMFDHFDLGAVPDGKGLLVLIFLEDRELRIETGPAFAGPEDTAAIEGIIAGTLTPALAGDDAAGGIAATVEALAAQVIADPVAAPAAAPAPATEGGGGSLWVVLGVIAAGIAGIVALIRRNAAKLAAEPCPSCGKPGLTRATVTLKEATEKAEGRGERRVTCPHCGHAEAVPFSISRKEPATAAKAAPAGKDAQKGQGGGASGSW